jgi:uncharacterized protein (DUF433 family)
MHQMDVSREHIEIVEGARGPKPCILGTRIRVVDILGWHEGQGMSVADIVEEFPHITRGDVYAALAYYWDNKDEVDRWIADDEAYVAEMKRLHPGRLEEALKQRSVG